MWTQLATESYGRLQMIVTLKISLGSGMYTNEQDEGWQCAMEIDSEATLEELHLAIQTAVNFENDHLYEFYIARTARSRERIRFEDENEAIYTTDLEDVFPLQKNRKLFYMFDYGDSWLFKIAQTRKKPFPAAARTKYPRVISESGEKPEQYPDFDEE